MRPHPICLFGRKALATAFMCAFLAGCSADYGRLKSDDAVTQAFRNHEMHAEYRYYYSGGANNPAAIVGIDPAFEFSSKFWTAIEPSQFSTMVGRMHTDYRLLYGAYMLAPDGRKAGVWYSRVNTFTAKFEENRIIVFSPKPQGGMGR
ncbi:MAG: hypothetical protein U5R30_06820 [Deltaproteobacteria bacterium]|nr:hypothetical protein [Deltaproteobacteria bacterium]